MQQSSVLTNLLPMRTIIRATAQHSYGAGCSAFFVRSKPRPQLGLLSAIRTFQLETSGLPVTRGQSESWLQCGQARPGYWTHRFQ